MIENNTKRFKKRLMKAAIKGCDVTKADLKGKSRKRHLARTRQALMVLLYENTNMSLPDVGQVFNRDHTTVLHAVKIREDLKPWMKIIKEYYYKDNMKWY